MVSQKNEKSTLYFFHLVAVFVVSHLCSIKYSFLQHIGICVYLLNVKW